MLRRGTNQIRTAGGFGSGVGHEVPEYHDAHHLAISKFVAMKHEPSKKGFRLCRTLSAKTSLRPSVGDPGELGSQGTERRRQPPRHSLYVPHVNAVHVSKRVILGTPGMMRGPRMRSFAHPFAAVRGKAAQNLVVVLRGPGDAH